MIDLARILVICFIACEGEAMTERRVYATLVIKSVDSSPEDISDAMRPLEGVTQAGGESISSRPNSSLATHSTWMLSTRNLANELREDSPISDHIEWILKKINGKQHAIEGLAVNCDVELSCFLSTDSASYWFDVPHEIVRKLADQKIDLVFDIYTS